MLPVDGAHDDEVAAALAVESEDLKGPVEHAVVGRQRLPPLAVARPLDSGHRARTIPNPYDPTRPIGFELDHRRRYPQLEGHELGPWIDIEIESVSGWSAS